MNSLTTTQMRRIICCGIGFAVFGMSFVTGYLIGQKDGIKKGSSSMLSTVQKIMLGVLIDKGKEEADQKT